MNTFPGLTWEFEDPSDEVNFMDLTITIQNGHISTSLFEKPLDLHLYIPPHSANPPGLLPGIVHSTLFRIFTLCPKTREKCNIERMIIAYSCPMNIGNLLSHRNFNTNPTAPPV